MAVARQRAQGRLKAIVVNDAYRLAPWADICYFADARWWHWHKAKPEFLAFTGQRCTIFDTGNAVDNPDVFMLRNGGTEGLSDTPTELRTGRTSGYQAINLAVLAGATRILLLGYDGKVAADGKPHWFGDHPVTSDPGTISMLSRNLAWLVKPLAERGVEVINCSPDSAVSVFPKQSLESALAEESLHRPAHRAGDSPERVLVWPERARL